MDKAKNESNKTNSGDKDEIKEILRNALRTSDLDFGDMDMAKIDELSEGDEEVRQILERLVMYYGTLDPSIRPDDAKDYGVELFNVLKEGRDSTDEYTEKDPLKLIEERWNPGERRDAILALYHESGDDIESTYYLLATKLL